MRFALVTATTAILALTVACVPTDDARDYAQLLPDNRIQVNLPTELEGTARLDGWSQSYLITAKVTDDINGLLAGILLTVDAVTELPPTWSSEEDNTAVWGPWANALDPVETTLWVHHDVDTDEYAWGVNQRPKNQGDVEWTTVIAGVVDAGATPDSSSGYFGADFDAAAQLDPNVGLRGQFLSEYAISADGTVVATAGFEDFGDAGGDTTDAYYHYEQVPQGEGKMDLAYNADVHENGSADEVRLLRSRWVATGAGRSDLSVPEGELGELIATASECWGETFESEYWTDNFSGAGEVGDVSVCAFAEPEYNESEEIIAR